MTTPAAAPTQTVAIFGAETELGAGVALALARTGRYRLRVYLSERSSAANDNGTSSASNNNEEAGSAAANAGARLRTLRGEFGHLVEFVQSNESSAGRGEVDRAGIESTLNGATLVYLQTHTDFGDLHNAKAKEVGFGKAVAEACRSARVEHLVFQTQLSPQRVIGLSARHMDAKFEIEEHIRRLNLPATFVIVPTFYDALIDKVLFEKTGPNLFKIRVPAGSARMDLMDLEDAVVITSGLFDPSHRKKHAGRTISLSACKLSVAEVARLLTARLLPFKFKDAQITREEYRDIGGADRHDMASAFEFLVRVDQKCDVEGTRELLPGLRPFDSWLELNEKRFRGVLTQ